MSLPIELYSDGSCSMNPGPGGYGYIIRYFKDEDGEVPKEMDFEEKGGYRLTTNNRMEIMGGLFGIRDILKKIEDKIIEGNVVSVFSDSQYFIDAINKRWIDKWAQNNWVSATTQFPIKNRDLWEQVIDTLKYAKEKGITITFTHVRGHSNIEYNEKADRLAVSASADSASYKIDEKYEEERNKRRGFGHFDKKE